MQIKVAPRLFEEPILDVVAPCDVVLITHAHMDHMDNAPLEQLSPARIVLPAGSERFLSRAVMARHQVTPMQMGETLPIDELEIVSVPAQHGGWRYP